MLVTHCNRNIIKYILAILYPVAEIACAVYLADVEFLSFNQNGTEQLQEQQ